MQRWHAGRCKIYATLHEKKFKKKRFQALTYLRNTITVFLDERDDTNQGTR